MPDMDATPGTETTPERCDLIVAGTSRAAVSLAIEAAEAGLQKVVVVGDGPVAVPDAQTAYGVDVRSTTVETVDEDEAGVVATTPDGSFRAPVLVADAGPTAAVPEWPIPVPDSLAGRVHVGTPGVDTWDMDLLVVGGSEHAAEVALDATAAGSRVVLVRMGSSVRHLSRLLRGELLRREAERRLSVLWNSIPARIDDVEGRPIVVFSDVGTPDLVFDHVVFADPPDLGVVPAARGRRWTLGDGPGDLPPGRAWSVVRDAAFPDRAAAVPHRDDDIDVETLRATHYNATITQFERTHSDLWVIRVRPDHGDTAYVAGQYGSLGLGYWEPRSDGARDRNLDAKWTKLVRRSYSISSPMFDRHGYLHDPVAADTLEFYIVLVPPSGSRIPALTPRLALRRPGDRIYVGPRVAGRYTLEPVKDPEATVVFFATGTGEAPHNAMVTELLRKGHVGPIVSVVSVRYREDLAYLKTHRRLEERFPSYHYLPLVTRDPEREKLYCQDVIRRDLLADEFGVELDPATTHVYLCGNPAMIGNPEWDDGEPRFPAEVGACELLAERGFDLDHRGHVGTVHTEKYW